MNALFWAAGSLSCVVHCACAHLPAVSAAPSHVLTVATLTPVAGMMPNSASSPPLPVHLHLPCCPTAARMDHHMFIYDTHSMGKLNIIEITWILSILSLSVSWWHWVSFQTRRERDTHTHTHTQQGTETETDRQTDRERERISTAEVRQ